MNSVPFIMITAGLLFGLYPICILYSELRAINATFVILITSLLLVLPFVKYDELISSFTHEYNHEKLFAVLAGCISVVALVLFFNGLVQIQTKKLSYAMYFAIMLSMQLILPAVREIIIYGFSVKLFFGFISLGIAVGISAYLLTPTQ